MVAACKLYSHFISVLICHIFISSSVGSEKLKRYENEINFEQTKGIEKLGRTTDYDTAKLELSEFFAREILPNIFDTKSDKSTSEEIDLDSSKKYIVQPSSKREYRPKINRPIISSRGNKTKLHILNEKESVHLSDHKDNVKYINEWLVHISGGEGVASAIVSDLGYDFKGSVKGFTDIYVVSHRLNHHNRKRESEAVTKRISSHIQVVWAEQQIARTRVKRRIMNQLKRESSETARFNAPMEGSAFSIEAKYKENLFNDILWKHQWYLYDSRTMEGLPELDLKVIPVWQSGITGKNVKILIVDDGLEWNHKEIINHYDPSISYDFNDDDYDPSPRMDAGLTNSHGTRCAGEIVMEPNNTICGVGISFGAKIGGIRALDGDVTDKIEGLSLAWGIEHIVDIVSCSWGPTDDGKSVEGPGKLAQEALYKGVTEGRAGRGIIYVWAAGNGGSNNDNCNCDGYASSMYTVSIGSASESGSAPWYGEHCASTLTSTYSSGAYSDQKIVTTDLKDECTIDFAGTSAATPLGAGIVALALEANPSLTWRDVQYAIVLTSEWRQLTHDKDWKRNGRGLLFNNKFGFGLMNAEALVLAVQNWTSVPESHSCIENGNVSQDNILKSGKILKIEIVVSCTVLSLEHVEIAVNISHSKRGVLQISIISPSGTETSVLTPRKNDDSPDGFQNWIFTSVHTWGEDPAGNWNVLIEDNSKTNENGFVESLALILHGTSSIPEVFGYLIK